MSRQARLDIPGLLQHVIIRGIERSDIFLDDDDRQQFVDRLGGLLVETGTDCFAWALIPNHAHEEPYLLELTRYIHLNPLRAGLVKDLEDLDRYHWCGHAVLLGQKTFAGQAIDEILELFSGNPKEARHAYRQFLADGVAIGKRPELVGGGLRRSQLLEGNVTVMGDYDERVLGGGDFVASLREDPDLVASCLEQWI